ncbi:SDR family oxidoreductase [Sodalis ligni]|uniref:Short-subunit dehydrogenase n=1 Tax=Sodalis ligni TaxID=2697027 RepID=A0A4V2Q3E1_9GAMM|nr:SDR family oxidoreductase [Sodalis ligni]TCL06328.1 short-subunit dehydrogenase [Sodalis ligni]
MNIQEKSVLITGANRGIGAEIVRAFLKYGIGKVYAGVRTLSSLPDFNDARVIPVQLDITKPDDVSAAARQIDAVDILLNNAGIMNYTSILTATTAELSADMDVSYYGTVRMMQAFAPLMEKRGGGVIANVVSVVGLASVPGIEGYSASKAALFSATQAARTALKSKNIRVIGVFPGPIDTDMAKNLPLDKASPADAAEDIVKGIIADQEDIYPDPTSKQLSVLWGGNPKGLEQFFAAMAG